MAQISMDSAEWDLMRDKAKLLEDALKKEEKLNGRIIELEKEKVADMKANEKSVTIIEHVVTNETLCVPIEAAQVFDRLMKDAYDLALEGRGHGNHRYMSRRDMMQSNDIPYLQSLLYTVTNQFRNQNGEIDQTVTRKGLDEVANEIRKEYNENRDKAHKREVAEAKRIYALHYGYKDQLKEQKRMLGANQIVISGFEKDIKELIDLKSEQAINHQKDLDEMVPRMIVERTRTLLDSCHGFMTRKVAVEGLKEIWKKKEKEKTKES